MLLSSNRTDLAEVFIPCPFNKRYVLLNDFRQFAQRSSIKTIAATEMNHWIQPKFRFAITTANMYV